MTEQTDTPEVQDPPSKELWQKLYDSRAYTNSYEEFQSRYSKPADIDILYQKLSDAKAYTNSKEDFYGKYFTNSQKKNPLPEDVYGGFSSGSKSPIHSNQTPAPAKEVVPKEQVVPPLVANEPPVETPETPKDYSSENIIDLARQEKELKGRQTYVSTSGGTGGAAANFTPDKKAVKEAGDINSFLKEKGVNADFINQTFDGFKEDWYKIPGFSKDELAEKIKANPERAIRDVSAAKWQIPLLQNSGSDVENVRLMRDAFASDDTDFATKRRLAPELYQKIREFAPDDKSMEEQTSAFAVDAAMAYGDVKDDDPSIQSLRRKYTDLNVSQIKYFAYLQDVSPEKAEAFKSALTPDDKIKDDNDAQVGKEEKLMRMEEGGILLEQNSVKEKLAPIGNRLNELNTLNLYSRDLTPEEEAEYKALSPQYDNLKAKLSGLETKKNELVLKYPKAGVSEAGKFAQEILGQSNTGVNWWALETGKSASNAAGSIWDLVSEPFRSEENSRIHQLSVLGDSKYKEGATYLSQKNQTTKHFEPWISDDLKSIIDGIKNDKSLTPSQKMDEVTKQLMSNGGEWHPTPIEGGKSNLGISSLAYGTGSLASTLAPFILAEMATGGGATASFARKFTSNFTSMLGTSFRDSYAAAIEGGESDPFGYALRVSSINAAAMAGAGTPQEIRKMLGAIKGSAAGDLVAKMTDKEILDVLRKTPSAMSALKNSLETAKVVANTAVKATTQGFKSAVHITPWMSGGQIINDVIDDHVQSPQDYLTQAAIEALKFTLLGGVGGTLSNAFTAKPGDLGKATIFSAAKNKESFLEALKQKEENGSIRPEEAIEIKKNIENAASTLEKVPMVDAQGKPLGEKAQRDLLFLKMQGKDVAEALTKDIPDALVESLGNRLLDIKDEINAVYNGHYVDNITFTGKEVTDEGFQNVVNGLIKIANKDPEILKGIGFAPSVESIRTLAIGYTKDKMEGKTSETTKAIDKAFADNAVPNAKNVTVAPSLKEKGDDAAQARQAEKERNREQKITEEGLEMEMAPLVLVETPASIKLEKEIAQRNEKIKERIKQIDAEFDAKYVEPAQPKKSIPEPKKSIPEPDISISEMIGQSGSYQGQKGNFSKDGPLVIFTTKTGKEYELGSFDDIKDSSIKDYQITHEKSVVSISDDGGLQVRGKGYKNNYSDPYAAINRDAEGNIISVNLETSKGEKRTFSGNIAEDIAYQIHLKEISKNNESRIEFEKHINDGGLPEVAPESPVKNNDGLPRQKIEKSIPGQPGKEVIEKFEKAPKVESSHEITRTLPNGEKIKGKMALVTFESVTPSHSSDSFESNKGFPLLESGKNPNDRNYSLEQNKAATVRRAAKYDGNAVENVPIVTRDGVVIDGNDRTISGQIAARNKTNSAYLEALQERLPLLGFTKEQFDNLSKEGTPQLVFIPNDRPGVYDTSLFAKFNAAEKKGKNISEKSIELGRTVSDDTMRRVGKIFDEHENLSDFYSNRNSTKAAFDILVANGVLTADELPTYFDRTNGQVSASGKEFLETLLSGKVLSEESLSLTAKDGIRNYRNKVLKAILPITEANGLGEGFAISKHIDEAIRIKNELVESGLSIDGYLKQENLFGEKAATVEGLIFYHNLEGTQTNFRKFVAEYTEKAKSSAAGQGDLWNPAPQSKEAILKDLSQKLTNERKESIARLAKESPTPGEQPGGAGKNIKESPENGGEKTLADKSKDLLKEVEGDDAPSLFSARSTTPAEKAANEYNKAVRDLSKAEDRIAKTQSSQNSLFGDTSKQGGLFGGVGRDEAKAILDPLRAKVKETKAVYDKAQAEVARDKSAATGQGSLFDGAGEKATISKEAHVALTKVLSNAFPEVTFHNTWDSFQKASGAKMKPDGTVYGAEHNGHVFIDPKTMNADTPIHETVGHYGINIIDGMAKAGDLRAKVIIEKGLGIIKDSKEGQAILKELNDNSIYDGLSNKGKLMEALATMIGREGEGMYKASQKDTAEQKSLKEKVTSIVNSFYDYIKSRVPSLKDKSIDEIKAMANKDFIQSLVGDAFKGQIKAKESTIKMPDGSTQKVKSVNADVVNGFYSPLEDIINSSKQDKMPVKQWMEKFGKGEEAKWAGLTDWLNNQEGSVSKADIQKYLKENRVEVLEVVKGDKSTRQDYEESVAKKAKEAGLEVEFGSEKEIEISIPGEGSITYNEVESKSNREYASDLYGISEQSLLVAKDLFEDNRTKRIAADSSSETVFKTKFSQYQLEGEKSNYKEILVTLPDNSTERYQGSLDNFKQSMRDKYPEGWKNRMSKKEEIQYNALVGGENKSKPAFKSSHFEEPNILVHLRTNTRIDAEGKKVLFIEEVQSDWGQKGKKDGFKGFDKDKSLVEPRFDGKYWYLHEKETGEQTSSQSFSSEKDAWKQLEQTDNLMSSGVPSAPFVTDTNAWTKLGLKIALKEAVKQGADKIAWTTGEQQNDRYDLSKKIKSLEYGKSEDGTYDLKYIENGGRNTEWKSLGRRIPENKLEDYVGKDIAQKIINKEGGGRFLHGVDLKVGGKGMKGFYGSPTEGSLGIVGNVAKSLFKQKPKTVTLNSEKDYIGHFSTANGIDGNVWRDKHSDHIITEVDGKYYLTDSNNDKLGVYETLPKARMASSDLLSKVQTTQHSIDITPELKGQVESGLPLFQAKDLQGRGKEDKAREIIDIHIANGAKSLPEILDANAKEMGLDKLPEKYKKLLEDAYKDHQEVANVKLNKAEENLANKTFTNDRAEKIVEAQGLTLETLEANKGMFDKFPFTKEDYQNIKEYLNEKGRSTPEPAAGKQENISNAANQKAGNESPAVESKQADVQDEAGKQQHYEEIAGSKPTNITGRITVDPIIGGKTKDLSKIISDFSTAVKQKVLAVKVRRGAAGTYNPGNKAIKLRSSGDLDTTAHEIGHMIDDVHSIIPEIVNNPVALKELPYFMDSPAASKPPKGHPDPLKYKQNEGFAEWLRAFIVNPQEAISSAPEIYKIYNRLVDSKMQSAVKELSENVRTWAGATGRDQVLSNIEFKPEEAQGLIKKILGKKEDTGNFSISFADRIAAGWTKPLRTFEKAFDFAKGIKGIDIVLPENDPVILSRLLLGVDGKFGEIINNGMIDSKNRILKSADGKVKNLNWLLEPLDNTDMKSIETDLKDVVSYMVAERTVELSGRFNRGSILSGIGGGIFRDADVAKKALSEFKNGDTDRLNRIEEAASRYREFSDDLLKYMVDKERLSKDQYDAIKKDNLQYVAMKRIFESEPGTEIVVVSGKGGQIASVSNPVNKIKGSNRKISNPYTSLMESIYNSVREADRNEVLKAFRDMLVETRGMNDGPVKNFADIGVLGSVGDKNAIKIFVKGKPEHWIFQQDIFKSLRGLDGDGYKLPGVFTLHAKVLRGMTTSFPTFALRNIVRDTQDRLIKSNASGIRDFIGDKEHWNEVARAGGLNTGFYVKDRVHYYGLLENTMYDMAKNKKFILADPILFKEAWEKYENLLQKSETLNRVAEYRGRMRKAKKAGMDDYNAMLYSAFHSRDLIDFAVAGHYMKIINQVIPFSNAAVQGLRSAIVKMKENPAGFLSRTMIYSVIPGVALWALNHRNDEVAKEYEDLPDYQKDLFWNAKIGENKWLSIPKPYELSLTGAGVDRFLSKEFYGKENAFTGYAGTVLRTLMPFDDANLGGSMQPIIEGVTNHDFFRDKYIIPANEDNLNLALRHTETASRIGNTLQKVTGIDGRKIDHFIRGQFSYVGNAAIKISDIGKDDSKNSFNMSDLGFFKQSPAYNAPAVQEMLNYAQEWNLKQSRDYRDFSEEARNYFDVKTDVGKDKAAKVLIDHAKLLLIKWKKEGVAEKKVEKFNKKIIK